MSALKFMVMGAAIAYGIQYITKKRELDGMSIVDDIKDQAPEWVDKAKQYGQDAMDKIAPVMDKVMPAKTSTIESPLSPVSQA